ncbi:hypothetical protein MLD52_21685 [Puniceicoccaceae bacterium K14]|nr:hypothetical protein [Puniceicoccaceae bacterium K14]
MSNEPKLLKATPATIAFDIILTLIVWVLFTLWFRPHVPSYDPTIVLLISAFTAAPGAGTFYFVLNMFKVTKAHQKELKEKRKHA